MVDHEDLAAADSCHQGGWDRHTDGYRSRGLCDGCLEHVTSDSEGVVLQTAEDGRRVVLCAYCAEASRWFESLPAHKTTRRHGEATS